MPPKRKTDEDGEVKKPKGEAAVFSRLGTLVRVYTERVHGERYGHLASEFAEKNKDKGYTVRGN